MVHLTRAYTYKVLSSVDTLPIGFLEEIKNYLKISLDMLDDDALLTRITLGVLRYIEQYTKRTILTKDFLTYRDNFNYRYIELKRSPFQSLEVFSYTDLTGVVQTVDPSLYYTTFETDYSKIIVTPGEILPTDVACKLQSIQIQFKAGYGDTVDDIPLDILLAMYQLIADLYNNRGDCSVSSSSSAACSCSGLLNSTSKGLLDPYRILNIW